MSIAIEEQIKPKLQEPFPDVPEIWTCPITGMKVPKDPVKNIIYRQKILETAEDDIIFQNDLMAACAKSILFWINTFVWTFHQFDVDPETGKRIDAVNIHVPFITWEIQDDLFNQFKECLKDGEDILINKTRDMGASWCCLAFLHWIWLFMPNEQLLEMSRTEDYVDKAGNMKTLFQKHDYINNWLPEWMLPSQCHYGEKNRTNMHLFNMENGSCIDGEATTKHAASGDRRLIGLLDEFAKVENGKLMRSASRDACYIRIVNSTVAGPGTEYSMWKNSGMIKVFPLMFWDHPDKGRGRYVRKHPVTGIWEIRSPWFDEEAKVRSPQEMAREILAQDVESGSQFFTPGNADRHIALFGCEPKTRWNVDFKKGVANDEIPKIIRSRILSKAKFSRDRNGPLRVWTNLLMGRPDQSKNYIFGIDLSKGMGASNSVISIKCKETGEKIAEWRDANTPPYEMARIVVAIALWCGGGRKLPFLKWEMNGPGWDFGRLMVKEFHYPYYYRDHKPGQVRDKKLKKYGWHANDKSKIELLQLYDRLLAHGGYINHSIWGLKEINIYVWFGGGKIGPAYLVKEDEAARKTHGDVVIADALTLEDKEIPKMRFKGPNAPEGSFAARRKKALEKKEKKTGWKRPFDFGV